MDDCSDPLHVFLLCRRLDHSNPAGFGATVQKPCETRLPCHTCKPELHIVLYIQDVDFPIYCLLTPLMSPKDRQCEWLVD